MAWGRFILVGAILVGGYAVVSGNGKPSGPPSTTVRPAQPTKLVEVPTSKPVTPLQVTPQTNTQPLPPDLSRAARSNTTAPKAPEKKAERTGLSAAAIAALIVQASRSNYYASGRPCACPDDTMRNGRRCGGNSAYSKPGGAAPLCYVTDVTPAMIERYRSRIADSRGTN